MDRSGHKPSIKDVALKAGVALSSVSRVLNDHPDVSSEMKDRVIAAIRDLGYERDLIASGLRRGTTNTVGFVVTDIANPLFAEIAKGAEQTLQRADYSLVLLNSNGDVSQDRRAIRLLSQRRVDGLILSISDEEAPEIADALSMVTSPIVFLDREVGAADDSGAVHSDHQSGMLQALEHLYTQGHRRIGLLVGPPTTRPNRERLEAFRHGMERLGIPPAERIVEVGPSLSDSFGYEATRRLLAVPLGERPTAIIAGGNLVLIGVLRALRSLGIIVGTDVALVSCDDVPLAELHSPPISVIYRDMVELGRTAAEMLLQRMAADDEGERVLALPTEFWARESSSQSPSTVA